MPPASWAATGFCKHAQEILHPRICNAGLKGKRVAFFLEESYSFEPNFSNQAIPIGPQEVGT